MRRTFDFGKIDYTAIGRKINRVTLEVELQEVEDKHLKFSVCGNVWNSLNTDTIISGQILDDPFLVGSLVDNAKFSLIRKLWKKYHLNTMKLGTPEQMEAINDLRNTDNVDWFNKACEILEEEGLLEVPAEVANPYRANPSDEPFKFGHEWLRWSIPEPDLKVIQTLLRA